MSKLPVREVTGVTSNGITPGLIYTQLVSPARATKGHRCRGLLQPQSAERDFMTGTPFRIDGDATPSV